MINPNQLGRSPFPASASQWMLVGLRGGAVAPSFDPSTIAGLKLWLKADSLALSDGAAVSAWADSSANGNNFSTAFGNPIYKTNIVNSKPVVRFSGSNQALQSGTVTLITANYTIFSVASAASISAVAGPTIFSTGQVGLQAVIQRRDTADLSAFHFASGFVVARETSGVVAGAWNVITSDWNGTNVHLWRNGALKDTTGATVIGHAGTVNSVGVDVAGSAGFWDGDIAEVLVYNTALSTTDRQAVENYLKTKYATP